MPNLPVATIVGHTGAQSVDEIRQNVFDVTAAQVVENLLKQPEETVLPAEPAAREIVFRGTFEEVNAHFYEHEWSDGLPIVPPTPQKIEEFLKFTDRKPEESLGIVLPESRAVTIWSTRTSSMFLAMVGRSWVEMTPG